MNMYIHHVCIYQYTYIYIHMDCIQHTYHIRMYISTGNNRAANKGPPLRGSPPLHVVCYGILAVARASTYAVITSEPQETRSFSCRSASLHQRRFGKVETTLRYLCCSKPPEKFRELRRPPCPPTVAPRASCHCLTESWCNSAGTLPS